MSHKGETILTVTSTWLQWVGRRPQVVVVLADAWSANRAADGKLVQHWDAIQPIDFATRLLFLLIGQHQLYLLNWWNPLRTDTPH